MSLENIIKQKEFERLEAERLQKLNQQREELKKLDEKTQLSIKNLYDNIKLHLIFAEISIVSTSKEGSLLWIPEKDNKWRCYFSPAFISFIEDIEPKERVTYIEFETKLTSEEFKDAILDEGLTECLIKAFKSMVKKYINNKEIVEEPIPYEHGMDDYYLYGCGYKYHRKLHKSVKPVTIKLLYIKDKDLYLVRHDYEKACVPKLLDYIWNYIMKSSSDLIQELVRQEFLKAIDIGQEVIKVDKVVNRIVEDVIMGNKGAENPLDSNTVVQNILIVLGAFVILLLIFNFLSSNLKIYNTQSNTNFGIYTEQTLIIKAP